MQRLAWLVTPSTQSVGFALRLCIAMACALYLSMWLELDRPYWASLEVAVMMQPVPGMAVVRGFARAAGTVIAGCVGLLIVALFAQSYELSAAALACWVALCAFGANLMRNNLSYGFAIAGFITGITVILSHSLTQPPFDIAVARASECILAAIVTAAVNILLSPPTGARNYAQSRLSLLRGIGQEYGRLAARRMLGERSARAGSDDNSGTADSDPAALEDPHPALQQLAAMAFALEQTRRYVSYESPGFAHFNRLARRLDYDILALISAASSLHIYLASQPGAPDASPLAELAGPAQQLQTQPDNWEAARQAFDDAYTRLMAITRQPAAHGQPRRLADWVVLSRTLDLVSRGRAAVVKHGLLISERQHSDADISRRSEFDHPMDVKHAARNSLRTFTAVGLGGLVWVNFHDQLPSVLLVILLSALTTIFATLPNPVAAAGGFAKGLALAAVGAFVADFLILPQANSFAMLMLVMMPFVFVGGLAMMQPTIALPGRISVVMFSLLVHVQNGALPPFTTYIQIVMGIFGAISLTVLAFRLVLPVTPRQRLREQMAGVFKELGRGQYLSRERFETRMYDRLNGLALDRIREPVVFSARQAVLAAVNIGLETRGLLILSSRVNFPAELTRAMDRELTTLREVFSGQRPALDRIMSSQHAVHGLAQDMMSHAVAIDDVAERRLAIRASVSAELVASALADYALAFGHTDRQAIALGDAEPV